MSSQSRLVVSHNFVCVDVVGGSSGSLGYVCSSCFCYAKAKKRLNKLSNSPCMPLQSHVAHSLRRAVQCGHRLMRLTFEHGRVIFACWHCGHYASRQFRGLHCTCKHVHQPMWRRLFVKGLSPVGSHKVVDMLRVNFPETWDPDSFDLDLLFPSGLAAASSSHLGCASARTAPLPMAHERPRHSFAAGFEESQASIQFESDSD